MAMISTDPARRRTEAALAEGAATVATAPRQSAQKVLMAGTLCLLPATLLPAALGPAGAELPLAALALQAGFAALLLSGLHSHPHRRFGPANIVTAARAMAVIWCAAMVLFSRQFLPGNDGGMVWTVTLVALIALAMDGVDGWLARRSGLASRFGARFDMEVDAALIALLSVAALMLGKAGPWVLLIGAMRYGFVLAGHLLPALTAPLPESFRRKAVCVFQVAALALIVLPTVPPVLSQPVAALALAALLWSFARDTLWLLRR